jgi:hypothetical protein
LLRLGLAARRRVFADRAEQRREERRDLARRDALRDDAVAADEVAADADVAADVGAAAGIDAVPVSIGPWWLPAPSAGPSPCAMAPLPCRTAWRLWSATPSLASRSRSNFTKPLAASLSSCSPKWRQSWSVLL